MALVAPVHAVATPTYLFLPNSVFLMSFDTLGLDPALLRTIESAGYSSPSPIQAQAIPAVLAGHDILAAAQTGTGKTAGFSLPLLQLLSASGSRKHATAPRALVVTPTRELAAQVGESLEIYSKGLKPALTTQVIFGGVKANPQIARLKRGVDILVATPGRLLDLAQQGEISLSEVEILVLDEADRMLDMGFIHDIKRVLKLLPKERQNLLFSATFSPEIRSLAEGLLNNPVSIEVAPRNTTAERIDQKVYFAEKHDKIRLLGGLIEEGGWHQVLVFTTTKHFANRLTERLCKMGYNSMAIHGNKSQNARTKALDGFKSGELRVLVATDVAARGIDINELPYVVNYELPKVAEDYVHRIGRTGRAGKAGLAVSLVSREEQNLLRAVQRLIKADVPVGTLEGFETSEAPPKQEQQERSRQPRDRNANSGRRAQGRGDGQGQGRGKSSGDSNNRGRSSQAKSGEGATGGRGKPAGQGRSNSQSKAQGDGQGKPQARNQRRGSNNPNSQSAGGGQGGNKPRRRAHPNSVEADGNREQAKPDVNGNSIHYTADVGNRPVFEDTGNNRPRRPRKPHGSSGGQGGGRSGGGRNGGGRQYRG